MLSIPFVGRMRAEVLEDNGFTLEKIKKANPSDIVKLDGFSENLAERIVKYSKMVDENYALPDELIFDEFRCPKCGAIVSEVEPVCHKCGNVFRDYPENYEELYDALARVLCNLYKNPKDPGFWREGEKILRTLGAEKKASDFKFKASTLELEILESEEFSGEDTRDMLLPYVGRGIEGREGKTNGLVNGMINGLHPTVGKQVRSERSRFFKTIIAVIIILVPIIMAGALTLSAHPPIAIDGRFDDWSEVESFNLLPSRFQDFKMVEYNGYSFIYVKVPGLFANGSAVEGFYILIDEDSNASTGYPVNRIGADYAISLIREGGGIKGRVVRYGDHGWVHQGSVDFAIRGDEMEIKSMRLASSATLLLYYCDGYDHYSSPVTLHPHLWMLYEGGGVVSPGDTVERVTVWNSYRDSIEITQLKLHSEGNATVNATVVIGNDRYDVGLGSEKTVINLEAPLVISGPQTIEISYMSGGEKYGTIKPVLDADFEHTIIDRADGAYILASPAKPAIDGIFADWGNAHKSPRSKLPADIDLKNYDSKAYGEETYVYVSVYGMLFGPGTPEIKVSGNATGGNGNVNKTLPSNTVEIYVDADQNERTGYRIGGIGADYLVRLSGCVGIVKKVDTLVWFGSGWKPEGISMKYAKNDESMEVGIHLTGNVYYRMVNWKGKWDETKTYMVRYDGGTLLLSGLDKSSAVYSKSASVTLVGRYTKQELKLIFGNDKQVTTSSDPEIRPSITRTAEGTLWMTFHDSSSGRLQFANSTDGGNTWTVYEFSRTTTPTNPVIFSTSHTTDHVIINEVYYDPSGPDPQVEWIELYNPTDKNVDISGYVIADDPNKQATSYEGTWTIPSRTVIPAKGYILIVNDATYKNGFSNEFPGITPDFDTKHK